jgi:hypothetical protein
MMKPISSPVTSASSVTLNTMGVALTRRPIPELTNVESPDPSRRLSAQ